jgi:hypothetical protein
LLGLQPGKSEKENTGQQQRQPEKFRALKTLHRTLLYVRNDPAVPCAGNPRTDSIQSSKYFIRKTAERSRAGAASTITHKPTAPRI